MEMCEQELRSAVEMSGSNLKTGDANDNGGFVRQLRRYFVLEISIYLLIGEWFAHDDRRLCFSAVGIVSPSQLARGVRYCSCQPFI
jgi:hypothetical protein